MSHVVTVRPIRTENDYDEAIQRINALLDWNPAPGTKADDELDVLSTLVEAYEQQYYPTLLLDPIDAIQMTMEERGMVQQDIVPLIRPKTRVSELMKGKRKPTLKEIEALHRHLQIPLLVFFSQV